MLSMPLVAATLAATLIGVPSAALRAAPAAFPGETDPIGGNPDRLTQFHDDEIVLFGSGANYDLPNNDTGYGSTEWSPNGDYTMPAGITSDAVANAPSWSRWGTGISLAKGRFVVPDRDVVVGLMKTGKGSPTSWALQEVSFGGSNPAIPATVPAFTFTGNTLNVGNNWNTPGRIAGGDLDRVVGADAHYHDEIALLTEDSPGVALSVVDYSTPGYAIVQSTIDPLPGGRYAYPYNVSYLDDKNSNTVYPGMLDVAVGDFDGDGFNDIAVVAMIATANQDSADPTFSYVAYVYSYCQPASAYRNVTVNRPYCPSGATLPSLQLRSQTIVDGGPSSKFFHGPVAVSAGDLDGDGTDDLTLTYQNNFQNNYNAGEADDNFTGDIRLAALSWQITATVGAQFNVAVNTLVAKNVQAWYDQGDDDFAIRPNVTYNDIPVVTGLFKYDPDLGYGLNRRQVAIAYSPDDYQSGPLLVELWDFSSPASPSPNRPAQWTARMYSNNERNRINYCGGNANGFTLAAGNFAGVKAPEGALPVWGLAVAFQTHNDPGSFTINSYRLDKSVITTTADGPLPNAPTSVVTMPTYGVDNNKCGDARPNLIALDFDGDALQLGAPAHIVIENPVAMDYLLEEPPQHLDYFPNGGWSNVSRRNDFNVSYVDDKSVAFGTTNTKSSSWNLGVSERFNVTAGDQAGAFDIAGYQGNFSLSQAFKYDYQNNQSSYTGVQDDYDTTLQTQTAGGDSLLLRAKTIDIWRYPVYGAPSTVPGKPYSYYDLALPRQNATPPQALDDLTAQSLGYQPVHENGNILSYPTVPSGQAFTPPDLGQWLLPPSAQNTPGAVSCQNDTRLCIAKPLSDPSSPQWNWGRTNSSTKLTIDHSNTSGTSRNYTHTFSGSLGFETTFKGSFFGFDSSFCANVQVNAGGSIGGASTTAVTTKESNSISINVPSQNDDQNAYHFTPVMYVADNGTLKVAQSSGTDNGGPFWSSRYSGPDPALNLPRKFNYPSAANAWEINKNWIDAQKLRGFFVRGNTPNPLTGGYDVVDGVKLGQTVRIDVRVYNYSIATPVTNAKVLFSFEPIDPATNQATGPRVWTGYEVAGVNIPYHGQLDGNGVSLNNWVTATLTLNTSDTTYVKNWLPNGTLQQTWRVWPVLLPDPSQRETHGYRQPNVILTPEKTVSAGTVVSLTVQDQDGTVLDTISYTSKGTDDNIAQGLADAINASAAVKNFGATANIQDSSTTAPSIVVSKPGSVAPIYYVFNAGLTSDGGQGIYFVPPPPTPNTVPLVSATNLEYGQNNSGWGLMTVFQSTVPGAGLGADDPCAISAGYSAAKGPDIRLQKALSAAVAPATHQAAQAPTSLMATGSDGTLSGGQITARPGQKVKVRVSAFSPIDWTGFEYVTVYQGDPDKDGKAVGTAQIRGISKNNGGHDWFTWYAPMQAGTYELVARLRENWNDENPGNNIARLTVVVGPQRLYFPFMGGPCKQDSAGVCIGSPLRR